MKNTVTIDLEYYNNLRDFKENIEKDNVVVVNSYSYCGDTTYYYTNDEMLKEKVEGYEVAYQDKLKLKFELDEAEKTIALLQDNINLYKQDVSKLNKLKEKWWYKFFDI